MYEYKAETLNVVDGDTVDLRVSLGFHTYIHARCRLAGIDTPELHSADPAERAKAQAAKLYLVSLLGPNVTIQSQKPFAGDKYGRWLVTITNAMGANVNQQMIDQGFAKPFMTGATP